MARDYDRRLAAIEQGIEPDDLEYIELLDKLVVRMMADDRWVIRGKQYKDYATTEELEELQRVRPANGSPRLDKMVAAAGRILKAATGGTKPKKDRVGEKELDIGEIQLAAPGAHTIVKDLDATTDLKEQRSALEVPAPERVSQVVKYGGDASAAEPVAHPYGTVLRTSPGGTVLRTSAEGTGAPAIRNDGNVTSHSDSNIPSQVAKRDGDASSVPKGQCSAPQEETLPRHPWALML